MDEVDITVTDLGKKHQDKSAYQDDGEVVTESIALDKENLEILRGFIGENKLE